MRQGYTSNARLTCKYLLQRTPVAFCAWAKGYPPGQYSDELLPDDAVLGREQENGRL